jgi:shikimate kinase
MKKIILVGMPGSGKSAVGEALADRLGVPWYDSDQTIEESEGMSVDEIFSRHGEPYFRNLETLCITRLMEKDSIVLSVGGGAVYSFIVCEDSWVGSGVSSWVSSGVKAIPQIPVHLLKDSLIVYLYRDVADILGSVDLSSRPLLKDNPGRIQELYDQRHPLYEQVCHVCVHNDGTIDEAVDRIVGYIS